MKYYFLLISLLCTVPVHSIFAQTDTENIPLVLQLDDGKKKLLSNGEELEQPIFTSYDLTKKIVLLLPNTAPQQWLVERFITPNEPDQREVSPEGSLDESGRVVYKIDLTACANTDNERCVVSIGLGDDTLAQIKFQHEFNRDSSQRSFVPSPIQDALVIQNVENHIRMKNKMASGSTNQLVYDVYNGDCTFSNLECENLAVAINSTIKVRVTNFNPFIHSIEINKENFDRNLELQGQAEKVLVPSKQDDDKGIASAFGGDPSSPENINRRNTLKKLGQGAQLHAEMEGLREELKTRRRFDAVNFEARLIIAKDRIASHFKLPSFSTAFVTQQAENWVNEVGPTNEDAKKYLKSVKAGLEILHALSSIETEYNAVPINAGKHDELTVKITVKEKEKKLPVFPVKFELLGGVKFDFSAGVYATNLFDHVYGTEAIESTTTDSTDGGEEEGSFRVKRKDRTEFDIGLGVMAHLYKRDTSNVSLAFSAGAITSENSRINYLLGLSIIVGKQQRFVFSAGAIAGKVTRLEEGIEEGSIINEESPATINTYKVKSFIGLTYNLGRRSSGE